MALSIRNMRDNLLESINYGDAPPVSLLLDTDVDADADADVDGGQPSSSDADANPKKSHLKQGTLTSDEISKVFEHSSMTVQTLVDKINARTKVVVQSMFGKWTFAFGVANVLFCVFMFAKYPQHFWIMYIIEACYFFPFRFYLDWKHTPAKRVFYALDYCWIMNLGILILFCIHLFGREHTYVSPMVQIVVWRIFFGTACGPLLAATLVLPLPLVFHNNDIMSSIFIHFFPSAVAFIFKWKTDVVEQSWSFTSSEKNKEFYEMALRDSESFWPQGDEVPFTMSFFGLMFIQYMIWFVLYSAWQLSYGIDMTRKRSRRTNKVGGRYDTCFHANMRDGMCMAFGTYLWKRPEAESQRMIDNDDYDIKDFAVYMILHFIGVMGAIIVLAWSCNVSRTFHGLMLIVGLITFIIRGALFYDSMITDVYSTVLQQSVESEILELIIHKDKVGTEGEGKGEGEDEDEDDEERNEVRPAFSVKVDEGEPLSAGHLSPVNEGDKDDEMEPIISQV